MAAFDPGRNVGYAVVAADGAPEELRILRLEDVRALPVPADAVVVVGAGTGRADLVRVLEARGFDVRLMDERGTTLLARDLWRDRNPARGLARMLPAGLRAPPGPIDDYAAWAIALRYLGLAVPR